MSLAFVIMDLTLFIGILNEPFRCEPHYMLVDQPSFEAHSLMQEYGFPIGLCLYL